MSQPALRIPTYFILAALQDGPLHGYGIVKRVTELSEGEVRLRAGTRYAALDRLVEQQLAAPAHDEVVSGRLRRYYRLTSAGGERLAMESARLRRAAEAVHAAPSAAVATEPA